MTALHAYLHTPTTPSAVRSPRSPEEDPMSVTLIECVASDVLVDEPKPGAEDAVCPACGGRVRLGGTSDAPRYEVHNAGMRVG